MAEYRQLNTGIRYSSNRLKKADTLRFVSSSGASYRR
jgi:hypothetical protein